MIRGRGNAVAVAREPYNLETNERVNFNNKLVGDTANGIGWRVMTGI